MKKLITAMLCLMIAVCGCGAGQSSTAGVEAGQNTEQVSEQSVPEVEAGIKSFLLIHNPQIPNVQHLGIGGLSVIITEDFQHDQNSMQGRLLWALRTGISLLWEGILRQHTARARPARSSWARDNPLPQVFFT